MLTVFTDRWSLKRHAQQRNRRILAGIDRDTLRPLSPADLARRQQIRERMSAKVAERHPAIDTREFCQASVEVLVACAAAAPVALVLVFVQLPGALS